MSCLAAAVQRPFDRLRQRHGTTLQAVHAPGVTEHVRDGDGRLAGRPKLRPVHAYWVVELWRVSLRFTNRERYMEWEGGV